ncbi:MAG: TetR/AcrR family transcriptional regulator [Ardenticatenaceae bacterium]|nr:TetR/AcrR family transcriptional regulator [Ardenticatenaceae bacterium]
MATRTNNPELSQAKILESAQALFIENGFDGTSMSAIARHSGVTQSMIHHYFGSKEALWQAVKKLSYDEYLAHQQQLLDEIDEEDITSFVRHSLSSRFTFFQGNPQTARLLSWLQIIEDPTGMETGQEIGRQMLDKIRRAQASGQIRDDIEPENVLAISIALTTHWFQSRHVIENLTGLTALDRETADSQYLAAMLKVFTAGLQAQ